MANTKIILGAESVWKYYTEHQFELEKTTKLVACNYDHEIEVHITDEGGILTAMVYLENVEVVSTQMIDYQSTRETMLEMYQKYIYDAEKFIEERQKEAEQADEEDMIDDREAELDDAVYDLLSTFCKEVIDQKSKETWDMIEELKDLLCETLYECYGIEVYRPMYIADDDGNEEFCLYPYAEIME